MPPVESEADRAGYFDASDFGEIATIRGVEIEGFFEEQSGFLDGVAEVSIQVTNPTFQCPTAELPDDIEEGEAITVVRQDDSVFSGEVVTIEADGMGLTVLRLEDT